MNNKIIEDYIPIFITDIGVVDTNGSLLNVLVDDDEMVLQKLMIEEAYNNVKKELKEIDIKLFEDYYNGENTTKLSEKYGLDRKIILYRIDKVIKKMKRKINGKT